MQATDAFYAWWLSSRSNIIAFNMQAFVDEHDKNEIAGMFYWKAEDIASSITFLEAARA